MAGACGGSDVDSDEDTIHGHVRTPGSVVTDQVTPNTDNDGVTVVTMSMVSHVTHLVYATALNLTHS